MSRRKKATSATETGLFVYLGPSIRGVVNHGAFYRGTRRQVLERLSFAVEKYPEIENLIVRDTDVMAARAKIKEAGNRLHRTYQKLSGK